MIVSRAIIMKIYWDCMLSLWAVAVYSSVCVCVGSKNAADMSGRYIFIKSREKTWFLHSRPTKPSLSKQTFIVVVVCLIKWFWIKLEHNLPKFWHFFFTPTWTMAFSRKRMREKTSYFSFKFQSSFIIIILILFESKWKEAQRWINEWMRNKWMKLSLAGEKYIHLLSLTLSFVVIHDHHLSK